MGIHLIETFTNREHASARPGPFANARAESYTDITLTVGERSPSGHEHRVRLTMTRREAARLLTHLASALGGSARLRDAILLDAYDHRTIDGGAYLDGVQDALHGEDWT